jgi:A/G-specific adenine glycosylase
MYKEVHKSLLDWYEQNGRHSLPWRLTNDPYKVYVSEIMLQQTQVKTVLERFYFPFLEAFPTLSDVASSDLNDVLKKWEGLGYYTRARNLHQAAQQCNGKLPTNAHDLMSLSGIGRSTAHAIAAFTYHEPLPILDANVKRILHRYFALKERNEKKLWKYAYVLFDTTHPYEYNQAMMDLGSMICVGKKPLCDLCPFQNSCAGKTAPHLYPSPKIKTHKPIRERFITVYTQNNRYALVKRTTRFLSGLWGFYESEELLSETNFLGHITQHYSHFTLEADVYRCDDDFENNDYEWFTLDEIKNLTLSRADHKIVELIA